MTKYNVVSSVEAILFRRLMANRLIGYTVETATEIAESIPELKAIIDNSADKKIADLERLVQVGRENNANLIGFMRDAVDVAAMRSKS